MRYLFSVKNVEAVVVNVNDYFIILRSRPTSR